MNHIAVIIPAYNEEALLAKTLEHLQATLRELTMDALIVVVDNNSTDKTGQIAKDLGVDLVFEAVNQISRARNTGAQYALEQGAEYLIFLDADTMANTAILTEVRDEFLAGTAAGAVRIKFDQKLSFFFSMIHKAWDIASACLKLSPGAMLFCRSDAFRSVGGFSLEVYAGEDVLFGRALRKWARKNKRAYVLTKNVVLTSARKFEWHGSLGVFWMLFCLALNPFRLRNKEKMGFWYKRK